MRSAIGLLGAVLSCVVEAVAAVGGVEVSPASPTERDAITLRVKRSFTEDCLWEAKPRVRREGRRLDVTLQLKGSTGCDHAMTDRTFEVPIGRHPAGEYVLSVRWEDGEDVETRPLTIARAAAK
jgi:hypothetical protein